MSAYGPIEDIDAWVDHGDTFSGGDAFEKEVTDQETRLRARREAQRRIDYDDALLSGAGSDWLPLDLDALWDDAGIVRHPEVAGMFYVEAVNSVFGPSESGKTWVALLAVIEVLADGGRVVFLDFEDTGASIVRRLRALGVDRKALSRFTYVNPATYAESARDSLSGLVTAARLVVIDALTEALTAMGGLSSNSDTDIAEFMAALPKWCARRGPAVVVIDHATKESARAGAPDQQGSQHKKASVDGASYAVVPEKPFGPEEDGHSWVYVSKDKHGGVEWSRRGNRRFYGHLFGGPTGFRIVPPTDDDAEPTPLDRKVEDAQRERAVEESIVRAIREAAKPLKTKTLIYAAVGGRKQQVWDAIDRLKVEGLLNDDLSLPSSDEEAY